MNLNWLPWRRERMVADHHEASDAKADAERKLRDTRNMSGRVDRAAGRLEGVNRENHIRIKMEEAFRGHAR